MAGRLDGKVALVTGAGRGIGRATALLFARAGAKVAIADRLVEEGEATAASIREAGGHSFFVQTDVAKADDCEAMVKRTVEAYGKLDIAFNNAGILRFGPHIAQVPEQEWGAVIGVNLTGVFLSMKYELPEIVRAGGGAIVNTASVAGLRGGSGMASYIASKHGVIGLTKAAAREYAKAGVRVNAVCPGATRTDMLDDWSALDPTVETVGVKGLPLGRACDPSEIGQVVLFLVSDDASFMTGTTVTADGGLLA